MEKIQATCAALAEHPESYVSRNALLIAEADLRRDVEHDNEMAMANAANSTLSAKLKVTQADNRRLKAQLHKSKDMQFGKSSERGKSRSKGLETDPNPAVNVEQGTPTPRPDDIGIETIQKAKKKRGMSGRKTTVIPAHLPRDERIIEPKHDQYCECGCGVRRLGEQEIERLSYKPAEVRVIKEIYPKYACRNCHRIVRAKVPPRAFDYTKFDDRLISGLIVGKFADFLPMYRQEQIFKRAGVQFHRATMGRLLDKATLALEPVFDALMIDLKANSKLFMDETVIPQLLPGNGRTKTCYAWALCRDDRRWKGNEHPAVAFHFKQSRKGRHADEILGGFSGILQVDGYAGYKHLTLKDREGGPIILSYCWAHVRRKFLDVYKATKSARAKEIGDLIDKLYGIEKDLKGSPAAVRLSIRKAESTPIVADIFNRLQKLSFEIAMKSTLGEAIKYTLKLADGLVVFLADGRVEIDNNPVENSIRPIAMLRKNALFAGSAVGGKSWAIMASLIGTCKLNGVEPYAYFTWVFEQMAKGLPRAEYNQLLPWICPHGKIGIE